MFSIDARWPSHPSVVNRLPRKRMKRPSASVTSNPLYVSPTQRVNSIDMAPLEWWNRQTRNLPHWLATVCKIVLIQPSFAATERVFSILKASFSERQDNVLQDLDYVKSSLMLYNTTSDDYSLLYATYWSNMQFNSYYCVLYIIVIVMYC